MNIEKEANRIAEQAALSAIRDDITMDEAALRLIASYETRKGQLTPQEQAEMKQVTLRAVMLVTGRG